LILGLCHLLLVSPGIASAFIATFAAIRTNTHLKYKTFFAAFTQCPYYFRLMWLTFLLHLGQSLGFHLFVIPGIWFTVISAFALPLHVENRFLSGCKAIKGSYKVLKSYFWSMLGFLLLLLLLNLAGFLCFGFGALITLPVSFFAFCSCYNHLVGINGAAVMLPSVELSTFPTQPLQPQPQQSIQVQQQIQQLQPLQPQRQQVSQQQQQQQQQQPQTQLFIPVQHFQPIGVQQPVFPSPQVTTVYQVPTISTTPFSQVPTMSTTPISQSQQHPSMYPQLSIYTPRINPYPAQV